MSKLESHHPPLVQSCRKQKKGELSLFVSRFHPCFHPRQDGRRMKEEIRIHAPTTTTFHPPRSSSSRVLSSHRGVVVVAVAFALPISKEDIYPQAAEPD
eukprot:6461395-Ditylum_brightwellii.AAC.1